MESVNMFDSKSRSLRRSNQRSAHASKTLLISDSNIKDEQFMTTKIAELTEQLSEKSLRKSINQAEKLNDKCKIAGTTWNKLKGSAMQRDHKNQTWYFGLSKMGKELLAKLIEA